VKLVVAEEGSDVATEAWGSADRVIVAAIGYVELCAALTAAIRAGRLDRNDEQTIWADVESVWGAVSEVRIDGSLLRRAGRLVREHQLRAYDAVHLAALVETGTSDAVQFGCWDADLRRAASDLGYSLVPQ
jgi:predicted nucleic acid-binding protein